MTGIDAERIICGINPILAEVAFHDAAGFVVGNSGSVGTGHDARLTTDTFFVFYEYDAVFAPLRR
jgi:hypothetical protein